MQPNYLFTLQEDAAKVPLTGQSYAEQYVLGKLDVEQAHRVATGKNIAIALIDSEIDVTVEGPGTVGLRYVIVDPSNGQVIQKGEATRTEHSRLSTPQETVEPAQARGRGRSYEL